MKEVPQPKLSAQQSKVFQALNKASTPLSAYGLLDELRDEGFRAPPQIYRALERLVELGLIHRLESINAFIACRQDKCSEHNETVSFAICDQCGMVEEFFDDAVSFRMQFWSKNNNFNLVKTNIELHGTCQNCQ